MMTIHIPFDRGATTVMTPPVGQSGGEKRSGHWPVDTEGAYREALRELDAWCREHDWPVTFNRAVAEEAVRQAWF